MVQLEVVIGAVNHRPIKFQIWNSYFLSNRAYMFPGYTYVIAPPSPSMILFKDGINGPRLQPAPERQWPAF